MRVLLSILLCICIAPFAVAQIFVNPSFEGEPQDAVLPVGWHICSPNTTPDIFPGVWGVYKEPADGDTFLGMITRPDGSYESIGQRFPIEVKKGRCYQLQFFLSHSNEYAGFSDPILCRIWIGKTKTDRAQKIFESELIDYEEWKQIEIQFNSQKDYPYFIIEAAFPEENLQAKGNILIDQISSILPCGQA